MLRRSFSVQRVDHSHRRSRVPIILLAVLVLTLGCTQPPPPASLPTAPPAARQTTPSVTPTQTASAAVRPLSLIWWTPEFLSPSAAQPAGPELARQLAEFIATQQGMVRIEPVLKARYGEGGLLDYLLTAQPVAPTVLPDLIVLDIAELQAAYDAGLLQPLDGLLDDETTARLYPFARAAGMFDGQLMAIQWFADVEHAASLPARAPTPPTQWSDLLTSGTPYLFALGALQPGATAGGLSHAALSQYLSAGGEIDSQTRALVLAEAPLRRLLQFYREAGQAGLLPPNALELPDGGAVWSVFAQGQVSLALVSGRRYFTEHKKIGASAFSAGPGWSEPAPPVASGWALAIVSKDTARQEAAAALLSWLLQPERAGAAAAAVGWLPTSPEALATWPASPITAFLDQQLAAALTLPAGPEYPQVASRIQQALEAVVSDEVSVDTAVKTALGLE